MDIHCDKYYVFSCVNQNLITNKCKICIYTIKCGDSVSRFLNSRNCFFQQIYNPTEFSFLFQNLFTIDRYQYPTRKYCYESMLYSQIKFSLLPFNTGKTFLLTCHPRSVLRLHTLFPSFQNLILTNYYS